MRSDGIPGDMTRTGPFADREWRLVREESLDGATAMAYDQVAAETAAAGGPRTVRLYRWQPSTLSLGYRQSPAAVDWEWCAEAGVDVVRRPTGGGAIYHDVDGDVSYSIIAPADELPGDLMETYELLCAPVLSALRELGTGAAFATDAQPSVFEPACFLRDVHPAHDVLGSDGRKLAGNAQYRTKEAVIQHGSLSFDPKPGRHLACFADCDVSEAQFQERVGSVRESVDRPGARAHTVKTLETSLAAWCDAETGTWTETERERAREVAETKFRSDAWTRERRDPL
jgi:lipoate-protein ligase A